MDEIDKKIKDLWMKTKKRYSNIEREDCPEDQRLSYYIDGLLSEHDKEEIEQHLPVCDD